MFKQIHQIPKTVKALSLAAIALIVALLGFAFVWASPREARAATTSTMNFQARLSTNAGSIVADGVYNVEFKLYNTLTSSGSSQGSCSGDAACLWTETRTGSSRVTVANGYLTVELGSVTTFPTNIDWSQDLYLSMRVGGTGGSPSWDPEMSPRLHLTAVPYAFSAGSLGGRTADNFVQLAPGSVQADSSTNSSIFLNKTGGSGNLLQLQRGGNNAFVVGYDGTLATKTLSNSTSAILVQNATNLSIMQLDTTNQRLGVGDLTSTNGPLQTLHVQGNAGSGGTVAARITNLQAGTTATPNYIGLEFNGYNNQARALIRVDERSSSTLASQLRIYVNDSAGTLQERMMVDTAGNIRIGSSAGLTYKLNIAGDVDLTSGSAYRIGGTSICTSSGCTPASGSTNYIQNGTTVQTAANFAIRSAATGSVGAVIQGASGQTADLLRLQTWNGTTATSVFTVSAAGVTTVTGTVTNAAMLSITNADSAGRGIDINNSGTGSSLNVATTANPTAGAALIKANNTNGAPSGNLLDLQANSISRMSVSAAGAVTAVGVNAGTGLLQGSGGLTVTGAAVSLNNNSNFDTNINTGSSSGTVNIGGGSAPLVINSTAFDVTSAGALSGITTISTSSTINSQTISSAANFTGTVTIQGGSALTLGLASTNTGAIIFRGDSGTGTLTLSGPATPDTGNFTLSLPAITGNATVCTTNSVCSGHAPASGSNSYIQNTTTVQTAANFAIRSAATGSVGAVIQGANGQTADLLQVQSWNGSVATTVLRVGANGSVSLDGTTGNAARLYVPWLSGDSLTTMVVGSTNALNNQIAIRGQSYGDTGIYGSSVTAAGIYGESTNYFGVVGQGGLAGVLGTGAAVGVQGESSASYSGFFKSSSAANTAPTLVVQRHTTSPANLIEVQDAAGTSTYFKVAADGALTTRSASGTPLAITNAFGSNLLSVANTTTEMAANGGAEDATTFATNWTSAPAGGTITPTSAAGTFASGTTAVSVATSTTANTGVRNNLASAPAANTTYQVSFSGKATGSNFSTLEVVYSRNGGTNTVPCASAQTLVTTGWTRITCTFSTDGTNATDADLIIRKTDAGTARTFYIDNLSVTLSAASGGTPVSVQIGGGDMGSPNTLFTLDRFSGAPVAGSNSAFVGSMYYDTSVGRIQCFEADGWGSCGSAPDNIIILTPEFAGATLNGTGIGTMTSDFCGNGGGLSVNTGLCASGVARNFYKWTSPQGSQQVYSIYISYKLPSTFDNFVDDSTISLTARTDNTTNGIVTYEVFKSTGSAITACGSETTVTSIVNTWQTVSHNGSERTSCAFAGSNTMVVKINVKSNSNANVYVGDLSFTYTNK